MVVGVGGEGGVKYTIEILIGRGGGGGGGVSNIDAAVQCPCEWNMGCACVLTLWCLCVF